MIYSLKSYAKSDKGFTLVELMVVLAIIMVISTVIITNQSSFNKTLILANTAYDIALTIRSAQNFGIGGRSPAVGAVNAGYGVRFRKAIDNSFIFFADTNSPNASNCHGLPPSGDISAPDAQFGNCIYGGASERINTYTLGNGMTISRFCAFTAGSWLCSDSSVPLSTLDIVFVRPNPDAFIRVNGVGVPLTSYSKACITVKSPEGRIKRITVSESGQIIANAPSCS